ncbi:hypothetical protein EYF80_045438 [Liparis tanakae]|uniref:Uncharacterized protein n=1 Tax=Liparis tanakae TaxID=230148 RepID=A0A4Z2FVK4_9TELE|nr:hypothetical protein EYF80_045438 [Liparis tanakae]
MHLTVPQCTSPSHNAPHHPSGPLVEEVDSKFRWRSGIHQMMMALLRAATFVTGINAGSNGSDATFRHYRGGLAE